MAKQSVTNMETGSLPMGSGNNAGELEVLRDLIFGNQARDFAHRITDLDGRLETVRRELRSEQDSRAQSVAKTASDQTVALRKEANSRIDKEVQIIGERIEQMSADLRELVETSSQALESVWLVCSKTSASISASSKKEHDAAMTICAPNCLPSAPGWRTERPLVMISARCSKKSASGYRRPRRSPPASLAMRNSDRQHHG